MGKPNIFLFAGITILVVFYIGALINTQKSEVLGLISPLEGITPTATPSMTLSLNASPSATITATPSATPTEKIVPTPTASMSQEVSGFVDRFSAQYGVDPNVIRYVAICESGFKSNAKNGPYIGLFQFGEITWINMRNEMDEDPSPDLRYSAEESVQTAAYAIAKGKGKIWPNCFP